jgi:hypothetical protein
MLALIALLVLLGNLVWRVWADAREAQQGYQERNIPNTDLNPYGANFFLGREVEPWKIDRTLHMAADAGIGWVKQQFPWEQIEPQRKGEFLDPQTKEDSWAKWDRIVEACERYGLQIVARLDRPPDWTRQDNSYRQSPPDNFEDYGDFVYAFVSRYKGRIRYIQIWNEPNIFPEWGNRPVDPAAYVELLRVAYRRAKEADPNIYVLSAPLAITLGEPHPEPGRWRSMNDLDYLSAMYEAGLADCYDIYSANAFGLDLPPDSPPDPQVLNFQRVLLHREIMERYGDGNKAVWFNEYGWNAAPEGMAPDKLIWGRVSEREQAEYTIEGIRMAREEWPWAGVFMIWYFRQVGNLTPDQAEYYFRMVDTDFTPRQVYFAVQDVVQAQGVAGPGLYQQTSPAVQTYGQWQQEIVADAEGGAWLRAGQPGDSVTLTFRGQAVALLTQTGPQGGRLLVSLDGQAVGGLTTDAQGASYVSLYTPETQTGARIPLVRNAGPGEHTLRLIAASDADPDSLGHEVVVDAFEVLAGEGQPFPLGSLLGLAAGLVLVSVLLWRVWRRLRWAMPGAEGWRVQPPWR